MGTLYYGAVRTPITVEDRTLAHVKVLITSKLRRNESFLLSWTEPVDTGSGRGSVWIHPYLDIIYRFDGGTQPALDRELLDQMAMEASSSSGLRVEEAHMDRILPTIGSR
jgi:hypothetical protein